MSQDIADLEVEAGRASSSSSNSSSNNNSSSDLTLESYEDRTPSISRWRMLALTLPNLGIQVLWLIMMSYGTPYMTGLGMPTSITALVWLSGPLSGALIQPLFATLSDRTRHPWGKRKPYIAGGASMVSLSLLGLACAEDVSNWLSGTAASHGHMYASGPPKATTLTKLLVAFWACALNAAMQPLQSGVRALIVDSCPARQQSAAAAWSARFNGLGAVAISASAFADVEAWAPALGETKFKALCVLAVLALAVAVAPACAFVPDAPSRDVGARRGVVSLLAGVWRRCGDLPPVTRQVCKVQFCAWTGWFAVLYYSTTYVYQVFVIDQHVHLDPDIFGSADPRLIEMGKRAGTRASLVFACVTFASSLVLPLVARLSVRQQASGGGDVPAVTLCTLSLGRVWQLAHCLFAALMLLTSFVYTVPAATVVVGALGVAWAVASWAPYALISTEIASLKARREGWDGSAEKEEVGGAVDWVDESTAGIMGVHNMAISLPQVCAALGCRDWTVPM
ncbi:putative general alpha-glucoside permease protein [Neofusicoccum parvum UCRNP2]|uniref:Putative general alpha-glucoside permease protein n=1 Tax=Botryosphaeria parva (strain UCR-NP2) TaxID=1287680 RepID=R1GX17_BOTPV|nr:putative general alpha-glucoside permease protein [Neofusicoccum parvum UCRNP2]